MGRNNSRSPARIYVGAFTLQYTYKWYFLFWRQILFNYVDDNVLYAFGSNKTEVKDKLSQDLPKLSEWFTEYFMILNSDKCHNICLGKNAVNDILEFCDAELKSSDIETVSQQTYVALEDVFKRPQHNNFTCSKRSLRRLEDILQRCLEDVLKTSWRYFGDK